MVRVDDVKKHAKVTLVDMSENGARLRATVLLPPEAGLSFRWMGPSRDPVLVHGHVAAVRMIDKKTGEYDVNFNMPDITRERLAKELLEVQRRKLFRAAEAMPVLDDFDFARLTDRKAYRVVVQFPVVVQAKKNGAWVPLKGEARDLSIGGMLLQLPSAFEKGTELEISFPLPSHAIDMGQPKQTKEVVEITPFGERRVRKTIGARAYEQIHAQARVVKLMGNSRSGQPLFGVNFVGMPAILKEEIARWIHTQQLQQLSSKSRINNRKPQHHAPLGRHTRKTRQAPTFTHREYTVAARTIELRQSVAPPETYAEPKPSLPAPRKHQPTWQPAKTALANLATEGNDVFGLGAPTPDEPVVSGNVVALEQPQPIDELDVFGLGSLPPKQVAS